MTKYNSYPLQSKLEEETISSCVSSLLQLGYHLQAQVAMFFVSWRPGVQLNKHTRQRMEVNSVSNISIFCFKLIFWITVLVCFSCFSLCLINNYWIISTWEKINTARRRKAKIVSKCRRRGSKNITVQTLWITFSTLKMQNKGFTVSRGDNANQECLSKKDTP